jgi:hypothetical protein
MARSEKRARRLVLEGDDFLWSLSHNHRALGAGARPCRSVPLRRETTADRVAPVLSVLRATLRTTRAAPRPPAPPRRAPVPYPQGR